MDLRGNSKRVFDYESLTKKYNVSSKVLNEIVHEVMTTGLAGGLIHPVGALLLACLKA
jgi:hypothetical protein